MTKYSIPVCKFVIPLTNFLFLFFPCNTIGYRRNLKKLSITYCLAARGQGTGYEYLSIWSIYILFTVRWDVIYHPPAGSAYARKKKSCTTGKNSNANIEKANLYSELFHIADERKILLFVIENVI